MTCHQNPLRSISDYVGHLLPSLGSGRKVVRAMYARPITRSQQRLKRPSLICLIPNQPTTPGFRSSYHMRWYSSQDPTVDCPAPCTLPGRGLARFPSAVCVWCVLCDARGSGSKGNLDVNLVACCEHHHHIIIDLGRPLLHLQLV